ncbi:acetyl-CoA synthetase-like protein [Clavulina sp. PMI_390]|nr:acetyl-CoA synthetase-like protein [Clavulina sp. PMI_390]
MSLGRLLAARVNADPHGTYSLLVPFSDLENGTPRSIEWIHLKRAVTYAAHVLNPLDENAVPSNSGRVIAILAAIDSLVYQTLTLAIMQSGNIVLPISQRNSPAAVANLLLKTNCHDVIVGGGSAVHSLLEETGAQMTHDAPSHHLNIIPVPAAAELYPHLGNTTKNIEPMKDYPPPANTDDLDALRCYIHSSGTTSLPKPIPITERYLRYSTQIPCVRDNISPLLAAMAMPPFHVLGVLIQIVTPLLTGKPIMLWDIGEDGEPAPLATPETTMQAMRRFGATSVLAVPAFLVAWSRDEQAIEFMKLMDYVLTGGGPLPEEIGDRLVKRGVNVAQVYGGTEFLSGTEIKRVNRTLDEWGWFEWVDEFPARWEEQDNGLFELQVLQSKDFRPALFNAETPDGPAYATNDLFMRHPTKSHMYKMVGRLDDQITLATGEKVNPGPIELAMAESPLITGAVLVGRAKNQVGILVQTSQEHDVEPGDSEALARFRNLLWPHVEKVNALSAGFAMVFKETIILSAPNKPFAKTPKGTVQRKRTEELYTAEIEDAYAKIEEAKGTNTASIPEAWTFDILEPWVLQVVEELVQRPVDPAKDMFDQGADSLTATLLRLRCINAMQQFPDHAVSSKARSIDSNIAFTHPSVSSLAEYLASIVSADSNLNSEKEGHTERMKSLVEQYTANLPNVQSSSIPIQNRKESVLITGTTGALGSALLKQVIESDRFEHVWALNRRGSRGRSGTERQKASFIDKGIDTSLLQRKKVRMIDVDTSAYHLGLSLAEYEQISGLVTIIIHNAWRLDFNLTLQSFEPQIKATRNLIDLALSSPNASSIRFLFTSSVGVFSGWDHPSDPVPEEPIGDPQVSVGTGYGESKYILDRVRGQTGLSTTSIRLGQLSGSVNGAWSTSGWFPILLKSSLALRCLPDSPGIVSWIPVDVAATAVLDAALTETPQSVLHIYHPRPISWKKILEEAATALPSVSAKGSALPLIPFPEWLARLEEKKAGDFEKIPALKLLSFYHTFAAGDATNRALRPKSASEREAFGLVKLSTKKMCRVSPTLAGLEPLKAEDVHSWVGYWGSIGFLA